MGPVEMTRKTGQWKFTQNKQNPQNDNKTACQIGILVVFKPENPPVTIPSPYFSFEGYSPGSKTRSPGADKPVLLQTEKY